MILIIVIDHVFAFPCHFPDLDKHAHTTCTTQHALHRHCTAIKPMTCSSETSNTCYGLTNSHNRPGVATNIGGRPFSRVRRCFTSANPPTMVPILTLLQDTLVSSEVTCMASSRVGTRINAWSERWESFTSWFSVDFATSVVSASSSKYCNIGNPYPNVLPLPVGAAPTISLRPNIAAGREDDWIGVGR